MNATFTQAAAAPTRTFKLISWGLRILAAVAFLGAGIAKLTGDPAMVEAFNQIGIGHWFRIVLGIVELASAVAILLPATVALGGLLLTAIMVGAVLTHLFVIGGSPAPAIVLLLITATITWLHRSRLPGLARRSGRA